MSGHHHSVKPGTTAIVFMKQGDPIIAKFKGNDDKHKLLQFFDHEDIPAKKIRGISPYKPNHTNDIRK